MTSKHALHEGAAEIKPRLIDRVGHTRTHVPLNGKAVVAEDALRREQRKSRDKRIGVAVHKQHRRPLFDLRRQMFRPGQKPRITDDARDLVRPSRGDVERHHRSLAEAD